MLTAICLRLVIVSRSVFRLIRRPASSSSHPSSLAASCAVSLAHRSSSCPVVPSSSRSSSVGSSPSFRLRTVPRLVHRSVVSSVVPLVVSFLIRRLVPAPRSSTRQGGAFPPIRWRRAGQASTRAGGALDSEGRGKQADEESNRRQIRGRPASSTRRGGAWGVSVFHAMGRGRFGSPVPRCFSYRFS